MKNNQFEFRSVYNRSSFWTKRFFEIMYGLGSPFRLILEVFIRKHFGQRYFSFGGIIILTLLLGILPIWGTKWFLTHVFHHYGDSSAIVYARFWSWYVFLAGLLFMGWRRRQEILNSPGIAREEKLTVYSGDIDMRFFNLFGSKFRFSIRQVEMLIEPGFFFAIGFILYMIDQYLGYLLMFSAVMYSLSYVASYYFSDNKILDILDDIIANRNFFSAFVGNGEINPNHGVRWSAHKPYDEKVRERIARKMLSPQEEEALAVR